MPLQLHVRRGRENWPVAECPLVAAIAVLALMASVGIAQSPQFRTSVQVAIVDATVVDSRGNPVSDLQASDFRVTIDGKSSRIVALEYVRVDGGADRDGSLTAHTGSLAPDRVPDGTGPDSRSVVFLFDDLSFDARPPRALGLAIERLLPLLGVRDRIGLATTSGSGPTVSPDLDHAAIGAALRRLSGRRDDNTAPFFVGIHEALAIDMRASAQGLVQRECRIVALADSCGGLLTGVARRTAALAVRRTEEQVEALRRTIEWMADLPGHRVLIFISDGIAADPRHELHRQVRGIGDVAAAAGVQLYALTNRGDTADVRDLTFERARARSDESRFLNQGVQTFAAAAGGEAFLVVGQPNRFLERIARETSAFYRLGVQVDGAPADPSKLLDVKVTVDRRGVSVRARHRVAVRQPTR